MKRLFPVMLLMVFLTMQADAQRRVNLEYYQAETQYVLLNMPANSIAISRFQTTAPAKIVELSFWFVTQPTAGDSVDIVIFGEEGGSSYPYFLMPLVQPSRIYVPQNTDKLIKVQFPTPLEFPEPTPFFVGVIPRGPNVFLRMDRVTQTPTGVTSDGDTMYTSVFADYDQAAQAYAFGCHFTSGLAMNNWYMGVAADYYNENITHAFKDVSKTAGLTSKVGSSKVSWADFDGDGYQDCLWGDHLYRNKGDGTFEDVAKNIGYTKGSDLAMFVDVDNDGDLDIVCMPANLLYINNNGTYTLDPNPGFMPAVKSTCMSFADYDNDKFPDFFVGNGEYMYMKNPANPADSALIPGAAWEAYFYYNTGDGHFSDQKKAYLGGYLRGPWGRNPYNQTDQVFGWRPAKCAQWVDYDDDGDMDLFVGNDRLQPDYLFQNQGTGDLANVAQTQGLMGFQKPNYPGYFGNTFGCDFGDYDNDGAMDCIKSSVAIPYRLAYSDMTIPLKNSGAPDYTYASAYPGSGIGYRAMNGDVAWGDFNNDGLLDFYLTTGELCYTSQLYMQLPDHTFSDVTYDAGVGLENAKSVAWVDFDNDGKLDLCVVMPDGLKLFKNQMTGVGNWTAVTLKSKTGNDFALGAQVKVHVGSTVYTKQIVAGKGAGIQEPYTQYFGIGAATQIDSVTIRWPLGNMETVKNPAINSGLAITEYVYDPSATNLPAQPTSVDLQQNFPNPFSRSRNSLTNIGYNLPAGATVKIDVYNLQGLLVRTLLNRTQGEGMHFIQWDGLDSAGHSVPAGTYQYVLTTNGVVLSKRLIVLK